VTTEAKVIKNISDDPLSIASIIVTFMQVSVQNLRNMVCDIEEKDERIRSLEEEVQHYKSDHDNIKDFTACAEGVRKKLHNMEKDMYAGSQFFQQKIVQIMTHLNKSQTKNTEFVSIREGLNEMKWWIT
jgi:hypothetical protein